MSIRIILVEDDARVAASVREALRAAGMQVDAARSSRNARELLAQSLPDALLLDLGLPDGDGLDLLREVRKHHTNLPVLILTARDELDDRVRGLDAGADDYLVKPFALAELTARLRALLRRAATTDGAEVRAGELTLDLLGRSATRANRHLDLTPREFDLLAYLARQPRQTVSRSMLERDVWRITSRATSMDNVIDVHIAHLREKVDRPFAFPMIRTVRGVGFMLVPEP